MGLYDRDYTHYDSNKGRHSAPQMRMGFSAITLVVKRLLIINVAVFFVQIAGGDEFLLKWFSVYPATLGLFLQLWRLVTYQFLHGGLWHIALNMLGLFFLGPTLERHWGSRKFIIFYLSCGMAGGLFYPLLVALKFLAVGPMIGASGAILGMLAACAILFPHFVVFIVVFPVPIRVATIVFALFYTANIIMGGQNAGGDAAHLAGMAAGAVYVLSRSWRQRLLPKIRERSWQRKVDNQHDMQTEIDRILIKVHNSGIHSLTSSEKKALRQATKAQQS